MDIISASARLGVNLNDVGGRICAQGTFVKLHRILVIRCHLFIDVHLYVFELIVCGCQLFAVFLIGDFFEIEGVIAERIGDRLLTVV